MLCDNLEESEMLCSLHNEKLKLFCLDHEEPVCVVCRDSNIHKHHSFIPLDEAALAHREELQSKLKPLQERLNSFLKAKRICDQIAQHIKSQAQQTERQMKEEFEKLHRFLREEEERSLFQLRKEEERKSRATKNNSSSITHEINLLSEIITLTHEELTSNDVSFFKNYRETAERTECNLKKPEILSDALIDVAKHLGNLKFRVWEKMKDTVTYTPIILDPNTAHQHLNLSTDLTNFVYKDEQKQLPENPERFDHHLWVLGSEGFHSGTHSWEVEVEYCEQWALGVCTGSIKEWKSFFSGGIWKCHYQNIFYGASSYGGPTLVLKVKENLKKIRVLLECDAGQVSFINAITGDHLQTFSRMFTKPVFPYFCNQCKRYPMKILPNRLARSSTNDFLDLTTDSSA